MTTGNNFATRDVAPLAIGRGKDPQPRPHLDIPSAGTGDSIYTQHKKLLRHIIRAYDSRLVRAYCVIRFIIININMLHILSLCMRGKKRFLEVGCGFGLFGCYFAARNPHLQYRGIDIDEKRVAMANRAAARLGLTNARFEVGDAREVLQVDDEYDGILLMDLLHHLPDDAKVRLLDTVTSRLTDQGRLIIKEISRKPRWKLWFTWVLDVLMTRSFDMWYWDAGAYRAVIDKSLKLELYPIADLLPYPHVVYLYSRET